MKQLNEYSHNLTGKEIIYDNGNWTRQGKWHEDIYKVNEDGSVRHVRRQRYWNNVVGESELAKGQSFVPECDGKSIYINGTRCKLPVKAEFELRPQHTLTQWRVTLIPKGLVSVTHPKRTESGKITLPTFLSTHSIY